MEGKELFSVNDRSFDEKAIASCVTASQRKFSGQCGKLGLLRILGIGRTHYTASKHVSTFWKEKLNENFTKTRCMFRLSTKRRQKIIQQQNFFIQCCTLLAIVVSVESYELMPPWLEVNLSGSVVLRLLVGGSLNQTCRANNISTATDWPATSKKEECYFEHRICNPCLYIYNYFEHRVDFYLFVLELFLSQKLYFGTAGTFLGGNVQVLVTVGCRLGFRGCLAFGRIVRTPLLEVELQRWKLEPTFCS